MTFFLMTRNFIKFHDFFLIDPKFHDFFLNDPKFHDFFLNDPEPVAASLQSTATSKKGRKAASGRRLVANFDALLCSGQKANAADGRAIVRLSWREGRRRGQDT